MKLNLKKKMKINININKREKIMLMVLAIVLIFVGYYKFVYSKQIVKVNQLKVKEQEDRAKLQGLQANITLNKKLKGDLKVAKAKVQEVSKDFFPSIIEEKIIVIIDEMLNNNHIICDSIGISEVSIEAISEEKTGEEKKTSLIEELVKKYIQLVKGNLPQEVKVPNSTENKSQEKVAENDNKSNGKEQIPLEAKKITLTLNFRGTYTNVISFIDEIEGFYKRIVIQNINIAAYGEGLSGSLVLDFYAIPKLEEEDIDYNKWEYNNPYGKDNMFKDNSDSLSNNIVFNNPGVNNNTLGSEKKELEYDFTLSVRPISSDLPTVMLGKNGESNTYVFADNEGIENVDFYLSEENGQYYAKYKTSKDSYPKDFNEKGISFNPKGDTINLKVFSRERNSEKDMSGVNIRIYNNTNKPFNIYIEDDAKERNRVTVTKGEGDINVTRN